MEKIHKLENDIIRDKDEIEKYKHEVEKLTDEKGLEERKHGVVIQEKLNLEKNVKDHLVTIDKINVEHNKTKTEHANLTAEFKKLDEKTKDAKIKHEQMNVDYKKLEDFAKTKR